MKRAPANPIKKKNSQNPPGVAQHPSRKRFGILLIAGAILSLGITTAVLFIPALLAPRLPARPDLQGLPASLTEAIDKAEQDYRTASDKGQAIGQLGCLYLANLFYPNAEQCLLSAIQQDAGNPRWYHLLAVLRQTEGTDDGVAELLRKEFELEKDYQPARLRLADLELKQGHLDAAQELYQVVLQSNPQDGYAHFGMARINIARGNETSARNHLEEALKIYPDYGAAQQILGEIYERQGDTEMAELCKARASHAARFVPPTDPWYDELAFLCYRPEHLAMLADMARIAGLQERCLKLMHRIVEVAPEDAEANARLGSFLFGINNIKEAEPYLRKALELDPANEDARYRLGMILGQQGSYDEGEREIREVLRRNPWSSNAYYGLGMIALSRRDYCQAAAHFIASCTLSEYRYDNAITIYINCVRKCLDLEKAIGFLDDILQRRPTLGDVWAAKAALLEEAGQIDAATQTLLEGLKAVPYHPKILTRLAWIKATRAGATDGDGREALKLLEKALRFSDNRPDAALLDAQAAALARTGQFRDALSKAQEAADLAEKHQQGDLAKAILERAVVYADGKPYEVSP